MKIPNANRFFFDTCQCIYVLLLVVCPSLVHAQSVQNYLVSRTTGITYNSIISTGNSMPSWRYTGGFSEDDNRSEATDIGFDFWYNGTKYDQFSVSTNGFMDFSSSTDDGGPNCDDYGYCNFRFSATTVNNGTWLALAPFYDDMTTGSGTDPLGTSIKYELSGSAPNRVLTVEWDGMAVFANTTPDLNFQVKIYETTGVIEFLYETMDMGTRTFSYTIGINASSITGPTAAELLNQQTANTTTFNNTASNNLSTMPTANSKLTFTPPAPAAPSGTLTFSALTNKSMTLNWTDWASNEVGYVIYSSIDNTNFFYNTQTAANATSTNVTPLSPNTTYYWRVYAVTEGALSAALSASQATSAPGTITSRQTGRWNNTGTWNGGVIPTCGDNVIIQDGHTVRMQSSGEECNDLTVGQGTSGRLRIGRNATARDLTIGGNLIINNGARMFTNTASNTTHTVTIKGNITNNGTLDMQSDANSLCHIDFTKTDGDQTISGTGATNTFYTFSLNKMLKSNVLEVTSSIFTCDADALTIGNGGTFKFSSSGANTVTLYNSTREIPRKGKIWMNSATSTIAFNAGINLKGDLVLDAGTIDIGDAIDENVIYDGGTIEINDGNMNIAGRYEEVDDETNGDFTMTGGILTLPTSGSTSATDAPFSIDNIGSFFSMSGGTIVIEREGGTDLGFVNTGSSSGNVTGGTLQIGNTNTPAGQTMQINSTKEIGNLHINSANATAQLITNNLVVLADVDISAGTLNSNGLNLNLGGDWNNTGGTHTPGTGTVVLDGSAAQSINKSTPPENFHNLTLSGSNIKTLSSAVDVANDVTINSTLDVDAGNNSTMNLSRHFTNNGIFEAREGTVNFVGTVTQQLAGNNTTFYNMTVNNANGVSIVSGSDSLIGSLDLVNGTFTTNNAFTIISNASGTGRITEITGGAISGNITMQRYVDAGATNWRFFTSPVSGATLAQLNDDFITSGFTGSDFPTFPFTSIYSYDETDPGTIDDGFVAATNITDAMVIGQGFWTWCGDTITGTDPFTVDFVGPANTGTISLPITYTNTGVPDNDGWNMVGNPYPCTLDWDDGSITKTNINNAIYIWNPDLEQFASYVGGIGTNGGSKDIASSQAFWVQANAAGPVLQVTEASKAAPTVDGAFLKEKAAPTPFLINIEGLYGKDQASINFEEQASVGYDPTFDAHKIASNTYYVPAVSTFADTVELSINQLPDREVEIPVKVTSYFADSISISFENVEHFSNSSCIFLEDLHTEKVYDLFTTSSIKVFIPDTTQAPRFLIKFGAENSVSAENIYCNGQQNGAIIFEKKSNSPFDITWKDQNGATIRSSNGILEKDSITGLSAGTYTIEASDPSCETSNINTVTILEPSPVTADFTTANDTVTIEETLTFTNKSAAASYYLWRFDDENTSDQTSPTHTFNEVGDYNVTLTAFQKEDCFKSIQKTITVTEKTITSIDEVASNNETMAWVQDQQLVVKTDQENHIQVRNALGQKILDGHSQANQQKFFALKNIPSQTLYISLTNTNKKTSKTVKVNYLNK